MEEGKGEKKKKKGKKRYYAVILPGNSKTPFLIEKHQDCKGRY